MAFVHHQAKSAVNHSPIAATGPKKIQNRVHRQCAKDGFDARIIAELAGQVPAAAPLHSHHATRQYFFNLGWGSVMAVHVLRAKACINAKSQEDNH
ncbi:hypothetical protein [Shewanella glacialimarina]|uniref:hypothetical protein n=1 Tax=Shewanella glacialimarina TaxID=2590884 RepID=UPI001CF7F373|nr:hypothetical protein [Shewanella glacialimarina]UCX05442.1 hypothetical protein FJ709_13675 [Shewanella glacialimarina]